ncbi:DddA-like double-stranded DNA deaminase toxin [Actinosynnema sp. NPDC023587]|uniref:DddA-like double-stranded DNA deaminase toxin n=1 Tax=Actinosynnema sp. NPDC023587 TaxID=3154695 RepID=UPI0033E70D0C
MEFRRPAAAARPSAETSHGNWLTHGSQVEDQTLSQSLESRFPLPSEIAGAARADRLRRRLPPPVQPGAGTKSHGWWFVDESPAEELVGGEGPDAQTAFEALRREGYPRPGMPFVSMHVEMKPAVRMIKNDIRHATLVIDNVPCGLILGCEKLLGVVLPTGFSLTVHGTDGYRRTFTGGQEPPW